MVMVGGAKLETYLKDAARKYEKGVTVSCGFFEDATYSDGTPVAMIAAIQEWGAPSKGIPPRPFMRPTVVNHEGEWGDDVAQALKMTDGDATKAMDIMGDIIDGQIRKSIEAVVSPPNSMVTNLLKQRFPMGGQTFADVLQARHDVAAGMTAPAGKPLVQSGVMFQSVDHKVTPGV